MSGTARSTGRPVTAAQARFISNLLSETGRRGLDTLAFHGGSFDRDGNLINLTGGWGGTASRLIEDLKARNFRDPHPSADTGTRVAPPLPTSRTNGNVVPITKGRTPAGGHQGEASAAGARFRANAPSAARWDPTAEQVVVVEMFKTGRSMKIFAGAGAGKTSTLKLCAEATPARRGLYVAFNKAIVVAGDRSFPKRLPQGGGIECRTMHSLAYRATDPAFIARMKRSRRVLPREIARTLGITPIAVQVPDVEGRTRRKVLQADVLASLVMAAISRFCQSADEVPSKKHFARQEGLDADDTWDNHNEIAKALERYLAPVWADLCKVDGWAPYKPEHYLKQWALTRPVIPQDYLLVDEAQDLSGVMLSIVQAQLDAGKQVVAVGDTYQSINEWMGAVNALEKLPIEDEAFLTKSFRFGPPIAALANAILASIGTTFRITGNDAVESTVGRATVPVRCTLSRSNAVAVGGYMDHRREGGRPHLVGQIDDIIWFCQFARVLQITEEREGCKSRLTLPGLAPDARAEIEQQLKQLDAEWDSEDLDGVRPHPELACFSVWAEVRLFVAEHEDGKEIKLMVKLVDDFRAMEIVHALKDMTDEERCTHVYATAHKMKGREFDSVELAHDFLDDIDKCDDAEKKLLYVAATRAKLHLDPTGAACLDEMWELAA